MADIQTLCERTKQLEQMDPSENGPSETYQKSTFQNLLEIHLLEYQESYAGRCLIKGTQLQNHLRMLLAATDCHLCCRNPLGLHI